MTSRDASRHLTYEWKWLPVPPTKDEPLPARGHRDDPAFSAVAVSEAERAAFRFSFPQLAAQTPDLKFYRLIQLFNTPLASVTSREAGRSNFALWRGVPPEFFGEHRFAHLWYYQDQIDQDRIVLEYGFDGGFTVHSERKAPDELARRHAEILRRMAAGHG